MSGPLLEVALTVFVPLPDAIGRPAVAASISLQQALPVEVRRDPGCLLARPTLALEEFACGQQEVSAGLFDDGRRVVDRGRGRREAVLDDPAEGGGTRQYASAAADDGVVAALFAACSSTARHANGPVLHLADDRAFARDALALGDIVVAQHQRGAIGVLHIRPDRGTAIEEHRQRGVRDPELRPDHPPGLRILLPRDRVGQVRRHAHGVELAVGAHARLDAEPGHKR